MAGLDASIYGQLQPVQPPPNQLAQLGQLAQLQAYQRQADTATRTEERQNKLYGLVGSPDFAKMDTAGKAAALQGIGDFDAAGKVVTSTAAANKDTRAAEESQLKMSVQRYEIMGGAMGRLAENPAEAPMVLKQLVDSQIIDPAYAQKVLQGASGAQDPRQFFAAGAQSAVTAKDQLANKFKEYELGQGDQRIAETARNNRTQNGISQGNLNVAQGNLSASVSGKNRDAEMKLSDDYRTQSKGFKEVADAYRTIDATLDKASTSPAATLAGATKFMKLLDPGSVVRESELGMAMAASGVIDRATNYINVLQSGRVLTPTQVKDFKNITKDIYEAAKQGQSAVDADYTQKAEAYGLNPRNVIQDFGPKEKPPASTGPKKVAPAPAGVADIEAEMRRRGLIQ